MANPRSAIGYQPPIPFESSLCVDAHEEFGGIGGDEGCGHLDGDLLDRVAEADRWLSCHGLEGTPWLAKGGGILGDVGQAARLGPGVFEDTGALFELLADRIGRRAGGGI